MMISPECYYEEFLKGKSNDDILSAIRGLKQELGRLKNKLEGRSEDTDFLVHPSIETRISMTREYLERAKQAYTDEGGVYKPSRAEKRANDFENNIDFMSKMTFSIGGFFGGNITYIVDFSNGFKAFSKDWYDETPLNLLDEDDEPFTNDTFIAAVKKLYIGEWRPFYTTERFGYVVCDGTQWEIEIEFSNGHRRVKYSGDNSYPYNFDGFKQLFGLIDISEDDDE